MGGAFFVATTQVTQPPPARSKAFLSKSADVGTGEAWQQEVRVRRAGQPNDEDAVCSALVFFVSIIFGLFTCIMLCDQLSNIIYDTTGIEGLQGYSAKSRP